MSLLKWFPENQNKLNVTKGFFFCLSMLCYSLYCLFLALCTLKWRDNGLQENESTNYATKRHKTHNHGSIVKLLNLKKLKSIIMHSTLENYIFYLFTLCFKVNCVLNNFFKSKYFWSQNSFEKIEIYFLLFLLARICFGCMYTRLNGIKLKLHVIKGYFWNINSKIILKKCKQFIKTSPLIAD